MVLLDKLEREDDLGFRNFTRLRPADLEELLLMVGEQISKNDTKLCSPRLVDERSLSFRTYVSGPVVTDVVNTKNVSCTVSIVA